MQSKLSYLRDVLSHFVAQYSSLMRMPSKRP
jgi:hypothetical protein